MCRILKVADNELLALQQFFECSEMKFDKDPLLINQYVAACAHLDTNFDKEYYAKRMRKCSIVLSFKGRDKIINF